MKKFLLIGLFALSFVSCKKDYVCQCTHVYTEPSWISVNTGDFHEGYNSVSTITNTLKVKKKDSESTCAAMESFSSYPSSNSANGQGNTTQVNTCELK